MYSFEAPSKPLMVRDHDAQEKAYVERLLGDVDVRELQNFDGHLYDWDALLPRQVRVVQLDVAHANAEDLACC